VEGTHVKIEVLADADAVASKAAAIVAREARDAVVARGRFIMAVSGGHTAALSVCHTRSIYPILHEETDMLKKIILVAFVAALAALLTPADAGAYGAAHVGYTHVGPNGAYHVGGTEVRGGGGYGGGGGGAAYGYRGGAAYGGGGGAAAGGYHYSAGYAGGLARICPGLDQGPILLFFKPPNIGAVDNGRQTSERFPCG
jgi:hypothetical protein